MTNNIRNSLDGQYGCLILDLETQESYGKSSLQIELGRLPRFQETLKSSGSTALPR